MPSIKQLLTADRPDSLQNTVKVLANDYKVFSGGEGPCVQKQYLESSFLHRQTINRMYPEPTDLLKYFDFDYFYKLLKADVGASFDSSQDLASSILCMLYFESSCWRDNLGQINDENRQEFYEVIHETVRQVAPYALASEKNQFIQYGILIYPRLQGSSEFLSKKVSEIGKDASDYAGSTDVKKENFIKGDGQTSLESIVQPWNLMFYLENPTLTEYLDQLRIHNIHFKPIEIFSESMSGYQIFQTISLTTTDGRIAELNPEIVLYVKKHQISHLTICDNLEPEVEILYNEIKRCPDFHETALETWKKVLHNDVTGIRVILSELFFNKTKGFTDFVLKITFQKDLL